MMTETLRASALDEMHVGLKAVITMQDGSTVAGGISDVQHRTCSHLEHTGLVFIYISGSIIALGVESTLEVELGPTQLAVLADLDQAVEVANTQQVASAVERGLAGATPSPVERGLAGATPSPSPSLMVVDEAQGLAVQGHLTGAAITAGLLVLGTLLVLSYGLNAPALSGHTILACVLLALIALITLRFIQVISNVQRWVL